MRPGVLIAALFVLVLVCAADAEACCLSWIQDFNCFCVDDPNCGCLPSQSRAGMNCNIFGCNCELGQTKTITCADCNATAADERFADIDRNRDGRIVRKEVERWVKKEVPERAQATLDIRKSFDAIDKNGDGFIDRAEFDSNPAPAPAQ